MRIFFKLFIVLFLILGSTMLSPAQFVDSFDKNQIEGWFTLTGDGAATVEFKQRDGYASILVDATNDRHNVYWTIIKREISSDLDLKKLKHPDFELRVEARVRLHHAPRRVNFMVNTQKTIEFHHDLMEFDIPDTEWHTISMTTKNLEAVPGDSVFVQLGVTDFGIGTYIVDVDYYRADIINIKKAGPEKGVAVPYHPPLAPVGSFSNHLVAQHQAMINHQFPEINFNDWHVKEGDRESRILTVNGIYWVILRWDLNEFKGLKADGSGLLELTTQSFPKGGNYIEALGEDFGMEFGKIRVFEIFGGDPEWEQDLVTYNSFMQGNDHAEVFNTQMIFDSEINEEPGSRNFITISNPVLQRLIDGKTKGILISPLGAINASFYASENKNGEAGPKLHFNTTNK